MDLFRRHHDEPVAPRQVRLNGGMRVEVAGEASYRDAIQRVCGGPSRDGVEFDCDAILVPEPGNPYDPNAIMVMVGDELVGYLPRRSAIAYGPVARKLQNRGEVGVVGALIRGGWNRSTTDRGEYGVTLDMARPERLIP